MPALLNPVPSDISIEAIFGSKVFTTLYVKFKDGFFPQGVFCCMIALSVDKYENWKLQTSAVYKDLVVFQIDSNEAYLVLCDKNTLYFSGDSSQRRAPTKQTSSPLP